MPKRKTLTGLQVHGGKLRIWFIYENKRCFESLNLPPSETKADSTSK